MIKIDLVSGFLGSGKTTFIKNYATYFMQQKQKIGILENDFGAVNVDTMLLKSLEGDYCEVESVAGDIDHQTQLRRMKTKLISMAMRGFDRIIVEPSGIFDVDDFFDLLHEDPLINWYEIGNVFTLVEANISQDLSRHSKYIFTSQLASAGKIIITKTDKVTPSQTNSTIQYIKEILLEMKCKRDITNDLYIKPINQENNACFEELEHCGYRLYSFMKMRFDFHKAYQTLYFMNCRFSLDKFKEISSLLLSDISVGHIMRIKGFIEENNQWKELNATRQEIVVDDIKEGQEIIIVIGENLIKEEIEKYFVK